MSDDLPISDFADQLHDDLLVKRLTDIDNTGYSNDLEKGASVTRWRKPPLGGFFYSLVRHLITKGGQFMTSLIFALILLLLPSVVLAQSKSVLIEDLTWMEVRDAIAGGKTTAIYYAASIEDRKSTRLNSSHTVISYAVFCLK